MSLMADNPRAVVGSNEAPDYAREVTERMARDYAELNNTVDRLLDEAAALPETVEDDETMGIFARVIVRMRDVTARLNAFRIKEKEPYLRGGEACDTWFFGLMDKIARRDKKAKPAVADVLQTKLDDFNQRKLAREQAERARLAAEARRIEEETRRAAAEQVRIAEETRLAAERARKPEIIETKEAAATVEDKKVVETKIDHAMASDRAQEAHIQTLAKPADIVRTRIEDGGMVTMGTEPYALVENSALLDKEKLWPFFTEAEKEKALRGWAKNTGYTVPMAGASIGKKPKSIVRR